MPALVVPLGALAAYLLGSISFAYLIVRARKGIDLRTVGSGNLGATNAGRVLGRNWALVVYALDLLKGLVPVLVAIHLLDDPSLGPVPAALVFGAAAFVGHCFPIWHGLRGGKGVATASGVILGLSPATFGIGILVFLAAVLPTRRISVGSMLAALSLPVTFWLVGGEAAQSGRGRVVLGFFAALGVTVIVLHRKNIARLLAGTEPRFGRKQAP